MPSHRLRLRHVERVLVTVLVDRRSIFDLLALFNLAEESLVAILDADKEGSVRSLIQTIGRAAQALYNAEHGITPTTVQKSLFGLDSAASGADDYLPVPRLRPEEAATQGEDRNALRERLRSGMLLAAENLDFETAAQLRDKLASLTG